MSVREWYINLASGNDSTGDGLTPATAWLTHVGALNAIGARASGVYDVIWVTGTTKGLEGTTIASCQAVRIDTVLGLPRREDRGGRWQVGLDTRLLRTSVPEIAVGIGASAWLGRVWGGP